MLLKSNELQKKIMVVSIIGGVLQTLKPKGECKL